MRKLLFVCLGNICRSPSAEAVMQSLINKNNLQKEIICDSCGVSSWHTGEKADLRMRKHARKRGIEITSLARQFNPNEDFDTFDLIIGMDDQNILDLERMARNEEDLQKIVRMTDYSENYNYGHIPDPYYGGDEGFELVLDLLQDACEGLLKKIIFEELE